MTPIEFVDAIRHFVIDAAVSDSLMVIDRPPGRKPDARLVDLSNWYKGLPERDRTMLRQALEVVANGAVFGMFAVLDGARKIDAKGTPDDYFELRYVQGGKPNALSGPQGQVLHELL